MGDKSRYPKWLLVIFLIIWGISFVNVQFPFDFFLEHILTVMLLIVMIFTYKHFRLSNISYTLVFIFMVLHVIGAHYTYSLVPYNEWSMNLFGFDIQEYFGFTRNNFDRLVHFSFGLLMYYPVREIFMRVASARGFWGYYLPFDVMASFSALYEIMEFSIAVFLGGDAAVNYNGEQGDKWDALKDMCLAIGGALISLVITLCINLRYKKDFAKDFWESLRVKSRRPLGEVELRRMMRK